MVFHQCLEDFSVLLAGLVVHLRALNFVNKLLRSHVGKLMHDEGAIVVYAREREELVGLSERAEVLRHFVLGHLVVDLTDDLRASLEELLEAIVHLQTFLDSLIQLLIRQWVWLDRLNTVAGRRHHEGLAGVKPLAVSAEGRLELRQFRLVDRGLLAVLVC